MKKRILVVDDNEDLRKVMIVFLEESGYEVIEAACNKDALYKCAHEQPHLMIIDVYLACELGLDISTAIEKDPVYYGKPKIIMVSGTVGGELLKSEDFKRENNIDCFLKKPFDFNELVGKVKELLQEA